MIKGPKKVTFAKYNLKKWIPEVEEEFKKTPRKELVPIDMREKPEIEQELIKTQFKILIVKKNYVIKEWLAEIWQYKVYVIHLW